MASGLHYYTEAGNIKPTPRRLIHTWILEARFHLDKELIIRSLKPCTLNLKWDCSENIIHCFKKGKSCSEGAFLLKEQMKILNKDEIVNCNPFNVTNTDADERNTERNIIDKSAREDDFIDRNKDVTFIFY